MVPDLQLWVETFRTAIVPFLTLLFAFWILWWLVLMWRISRARLELARSPAAAEKILDESIRRSREGLSAGDCDEAISDSGIRAKGEIGRHLQTLYSSGLRDASLDVGELNRRTIEGVCGREAALRTFLSTFVIIGLLGTLAGIAYAVGVFGGKEDSARDLLARLPGAFTPSIFGVFFSIVGSLMLVWTRTRAGGFSTALRAQTMEALVPKLVPTHSERIDHAAAKAVAAAQRVVEFAESIESRSQQIDGSLARANSSASLISDATGKMSASVQLASQTVDKTLVDLSARIGEFSGGLGKFADFGERLDRHEAGILEGVRALHAAAEKNAGVTVQIEELTRTGKTEFLAAIREMNAPIREASVEIAGISRRFAEICGQLTQEVAETSKNQTGRLNESFTSWRNELSQEAGKAKRAIDNLKAPFEESAVQLRAQAANSIQQMETVITALNRRGDVLLNSLDVVVAPLRELAAKGFAPNGSNPVSETTVIRLSPEDWTRIQNLTASVVAPAPYPVAVGAKTGSLSPELAARLAGIDAALVQLNGTLAHFAVSVAGRTPHDPKPGLIRRLFRRKPRARAASGGNAA